MIDIDLSNSHPLRNIDKVKILSMYEAYEILESKVLEFAITLREAALQETKEGEEAEYWLRKYMDWFDVTRARYGGK